MALRRWSAARSPAHLLGAALGATVGHTLFGLVANAESVPDRLFLTALALLTAGLGARAVSRAATRKTAPAEADAESETVPAEAGPDRETVPTGASAGSETGKTAADAESETAPAEADAGSKTGAAGADVGSKNGPAGSETGGSGAGVKGQAA